MILAADNTVVSGGAVITVLPFLNSMSAISMEPPP
jgi:hypothetical protein